MASAISIGEGIYGAASGYRSGAGFCAKALTESAPPKMAARLVIDIMPFVSPAQASRQNSGGRRGCIFRTAEPFRRVDGDQRFAWSHGREDAQCAAVARFHLQRRLDGADGGVTAFHGHGGGDPGAERLDGDIRCEPAQMENGTLRSPGVVEGMIVVDLSLRASGFGSRRRSHIKRDEVTRSR